MLFFITSIAYANDLKDTLNKAKKSIQKKDFAAVAHHLAKADQEISKTQIIVRPEQIILTTHYKALVAYLQGEDPIPIWRQAFVLNPYFDWDKVIDDRKASELFYLVRSEVEYYPKVPTHIPKKVGLAKTFVDGVPLKYKSKVLEGTHLLQMQCPKGEIVSKWSDLIEDPQWIAMCPYEFDVNESNDDLFSLDMDMGIDMGIDVYLYIGMHIQM